MGNGHTNRRRRGGGGNPRARHGPQRQQAHEAMNGNGQMHPQEPAQQAQQAMKTAAAPAQPAPRQAPREQTPRPEREPRQHAFQPQPRGETPARPRQDWPPARTEAPSGPYRPAFAMTPNNGQPARTSFASGNGAHNGFKHAQPEQPLVHAEEEDWEESEGNPPTEASPLVRSYSYNGSETRDREIKPEVRGEFAPLIDSLKDLFQRDRAVASQSNTTRCGVCYLHFAVTELEYREAEGFYVCPGCKQALARSSLPMIRRQQR